MEMDGYRLTHDKKVQRSAHVGFSFITSTLPLSGNFNEAMVEGGMQNFISSSSSDLLVDVVQERMRQILGR